MHCVVAFRMPQLQQEVGSCSRAVHNRAAAAATWAFSKTSLKHRQIHIKGGFTTLTLHLYY